MNAKHNVDPTSLTLHVRQIMYRSLCIYADYGTKFEALRASRQCDALPWRMYCYYIVVFEPQRFALDPIDLVRFQLHVKPNQLLRVLVHEASTLEYVSEILCSFGLTRRDLGQYLCEADAAIGTNCWISRGNTAHFSGLLCACLAPGWQRWLTRHMKHDRDRVLFLAAVGGPSLRLLWLAVCCLGAAPVVAARRSTWYCVCQGCGLESCYAEKI